MHALQNQVQTNRCSLPLFSQPPHTQDPNVFNEVTITTSVGAIALFVGFLLWAWRHGLLVFA